ncbi:corticotropin-releasing factor receptor 2 isoform X2 [Hydra vulgaris]|uniref:corticotropin-releasing factor receptor 2 isoform X2 n=1 Tax=Hydra vulgaris TaxID=6087 RepID=UPI001F5FA77C|nr:corticotropin-releasing factor receptor 2-like isoform X2 [Hydra vulgaris]
MKLRSEFRKLLGGVALKINALSQNQTFTLAVYFIKKCISPAIVNYDLLTKPLGNCATTIGSYIDCMNNTKNNTIYYHPCPYLFFESGVIPVLCKNGTFGKVDYTSYCSKITEEEKNSREFLLFYEAGIISKWQYQYEIDLKFNKRILVDLGYFLRIIDAAACFVGFIVLLLLIPLKNHRVMLHRNLIVSIMLRDIAYIVYTHLNTKTNPYEIPNMKGCSYAYLFSLYFVLVEITWMFNEAFFQFRQFFFVFITKSYMWLYFIVGWLVPAIISFAIFLPLMLQYSTNKRFIICWNNGSDTRIYYAIFVPIYILVSMNVLILLYLMWIIRSKLESGTGCELEKSRKAARSFFILVFLLGGGYIFVSTGPSDCIPFEYLQVILIAPQGIYVCIFQIFISKEVRNSARLKINRLKQKSSIPRFVSQSTHSTSISIIKRMSAGIFSRKVSDLKFTPTRSTVNTSSSVIFNLNLQICNSKNDLLTLGTKNDGFEYELR